MRTYLLTLQILLIYSGVLAQNKICLPVGKTPGSINYNSGEIDGLIHFDHYKAIILGEMHNGSFNPEIQYYLITQLNRDHGFKHVFFEMGVSCAWHYNQFLNTGDTSFLSNKKMVANYGNWPLFWKRIYEYNKTLPDSKRIIFHGVDFERNEVFGTILQLAPKDKNPPSSVKAAIDTAKAHLNDQPLKIFDIIEGKMIEYDNSVFVNALKFIQGKFSENPADTKMYFGDNYSVIKEISENKGQVKAMPKPRNRTMFQAIRRNVEEQKITKFIGVFGSQHTIYTQHSAVSNAVRKLPGIKNKEVLNIQEHIYNLRPGKNDSTKIALQLIKINGNCKATILPASSISGYKSKADFLIIGNAAR